MQESPKSNFDLMTDSGRGKVSHSIRGPLAIMKGHVTLMRDELLRIEPESLDLSRSIDQIEIEITKIVHILENTIENDQNELS